jgi:diguanylate cyclase (GGDEF)-like protein
VGNIDGDALIELEKLAKFKFGKHSLSPGNGVANRLRNFIDGATEEEMYALIGLMPLAQHRGVEDMYRGLGTSFVPADAERQVKRVIQTVNAFFETFGSKARFRENGNLDREGLVDERPRMLLALPSRESLNQDVGALLKSHEPIGIIFIDLDNFKQVNEKYTHKGGDKCLEEAVKLIYSVVTRRGKVYRYGKDAGDEFVLVMRNVDTSECSATANRVRQVIETANLGGDVQITASVGIASSEYDALDTATKLIEAADEAAHVSKHTGKNRVTVWPPTAEQKRIAAENSAKTSR